MPADLITLAHLSVSSAMCFANPADVNGIGSTPRSARRSFALGSARADVHRLAELVDDLGGRAFWARRVHTSRMPRSPARIRPWRGRPAAPPARVAVVTARARSLPFRINSSACGYWIKDDLHLSGEQIGHVIAAIRDVNQFDAGHHLEQLAEDMGRASVATRRHIDLAWIGFGIGDELREGSWPGTMTGPQRRTESWQCPRPARCRV